MPIMSDIALPSRRGLLLGLTALIASPAIVRASSLMPVKMLKNEIYPISMTLNDWIRLQNARPA
jgi:hypothetical protein